MRQSHCCLPHWSWRRQRRRLLLLNSTGLTQNRHRLSSVVYRLSSLRKPYSKKVFSMPGIPSGTITFLFTDIEGSTKRWERNPQEMGVTLARHDELLSKAVEVNGGYVFKTVGDAFCAAFATASQALNSALDAQQSLYREHWADTGDTGDTGETDRIRVRMALHTGVAEERDGDYFGQPVNRVARLLSAGHGGQTLLSLPTYELVRDQLPAGTQLRDMGEHHLKDLIRPERVFQLTIPGLPAEFPPLRTLDNRPNNLPIQATPLVGREKEVAEAEALLQRSDVRLLTLTGPGGTGKTRLGLQVAADMVDRFEDGVFMVALAPISDPDLVVPTVAMALGVQEAGGRPLLDSLKDHLRDKQLLLFLDNFEQIVEASSHVPELLASAPRLKALVTSRVVLRVSGEHDFQVPPLDLPNIKQLPSLERLTQYESVRLFIERAQAAKTDFAINNDNAPFVAEICVRLDGLPLAIELAAVRIRLLPPQAMLARLESRLKLLTGGARDVPARQQTLRNTIAWSYDLLDEGEKALFRRMSVFVGGRTLEAVEAVCSADGDLPIDVLDGISALVDKSLIRQQEGLGGEPRFLMLVTIREYALEQLAESGEAEKLRRDHASFFLTFAEEAETHLTKADQVEWLTRLEEEHDNLRAALSWGLSDLGEVETALHLCNALWRFWWLHGHNIEGRKWVASALEKGQDAGPALRARALYSAGIMALGQGDNEKAKTYYEESLALFKELGNKQGMSWALNDLGILMEAQLDYDGAEVLVRESLDLKRQLGDKRDVGVALANLGDILRYKNDYAQAMVLLEEGVSILREVKDTYGLATTIGALGMTVLYQGDKGRAAVFFKESLALSMELGYMMQVAGCLGGLAAVSRAERQFERAAKIFGAVQSLLDTMNTALHPGDRNDYEQNLAEVRAQLIEEEFKAAWAEGQALSIEQAIEYALEETRDE